MAGDNTRDLANEVEHGGEQGLQKFSDAIASLPPDKAYAEAKAVQDQINEDRKKDSSLKSPDIHLSFNDPAGKPRELATLAVDIYDSATGSLKEQRKLLDENDTAHEIYKDLKNNKFDDAHKKIAEIKDPVEAAKVALQVGHLGELRDKDQANPKISIETPVDHFRWGAGLGTYKSLRVNLDEKPPMDLGFLGKYHGKSVSFDLDGKQVESIKQLLGTQSVAAGVNPFDIKRMYKENAEF